MGSDGATAIDPTDDTGCSSNTGENFTPYTFRSCLNAAQHVKALAKYFGGKGLKKPFLLNQDYSWGYDVAKHYEMYVTAYAKDAKVVVAVWSEFQCPWCARTNPLFVEIVKK